MTGRSTFGFMLSGALLALAACNSSPSDSAAKAPSESTDAGLQPASEDALLLAAAEPFEALTEQAPTASQSELDTLIDAAKAAARNEALQLAPAERSRLEGEIARIDKARAKGDRTVIALASVEGYRTLVENTSGSGAIPKAVSLLDYAGFRYQADLAASPARWDDAARALAFAEEEWRGLSPMVTDAALGDDFAQSLAEMHKAMDARDIKSARQAATRELDLVDRLEQYFSANA